MKITRPQIILSALVTSAILLCAHDALAQRVDQLPGHTHASAAAPAPVPSVMTAPPSLTDGKIAAVVNDSVVTSYDVEARVRLAILSSGLPDNADIRSHLVPQVLRGLIEEQLQLQEAKRLEISVNNDEVDSAMTRIATDNHIPGGDMRAFLKAHGVSPEALASQIRSSIAWGKVVQRELRPRVEVGDDEIDAVMARIKANAGKAEYAVSEIFLAVDNPQDEEQVHQLANNLVQQIKGGASFAAVAHQFSQSSNSATGGDIGWIQEGQLPPDLSRVLTPLQPGQISDPVRTASGYHILGLREKRTIAMGGTADANLELQQAFRPIGTSTQDAMLAEATQLRGSITSCAGLQEKLASQFPAWHWQSMGAVKMSRLPSWMANLVRDVAVGKAGEPLMTDKGALLVFVCKRTTEDASIDREELTNTLGNEKLELQARRLIRDLRRSAYLDVRSDALPH